MTAQAGPSTKFLVIGLPEAGKTTFLAALWHLADHGGVQGALRAPRDVPDQAHLNAIRERWLTVEPTQRTRLGAEKRVSMLLERDDKEVVEVVFPDMSGESFLGHWGSRSWSAPYQELVQDASGLLLFVHPAKLVPGPRIEEGAGALEALQTADVTEPSAIEVAEAPQDIPWNPDMSPTEVVLVELLQLIDSARNQPPGLRVAVVISAWDTVAIEQLEPHAWLARRLPLLHQFLEANEERFESRVYGVSAYGGDPAHDAERLRAMSPLDRIRIVGPGVLEKDITAPVRWLQG